MAATQPRRNVAPWIALGLTALITVSAWAATWGRTCQRVDVVEGEIAALKVEYREDVDKLETRVRTVEGATLVLPDINDRLTRIETLLMEGGE